MASSSTARRVLAGELATTPVISTPSMARRRGTWLERAIPPAPTSPTRMVSLMSGPPSVVRGPRTTDGGPDMSETIRVGLVGAGGIARSSHVPRLRAIEGVEITGVVASSLASTRRAADELAIPTAYPTWEALVADAAIRRLLREGAIGTPRSFRATWAGAVASTGRDQWRRERRFSGNNVM